MIRVKLLSEPEYHQMLQNGACREYSEGDFYELLREQGDFTDEASGQLLRTLHGDAAVEEKWYRRTTPEGRPCLPAISPEARYGLTVIANSRKGVYTNIENSFTTFEVEDRMEPTLGGDSDIPLVWDAFAAMDLDVLLVFRRKNFSWCWDIPLGNDFILENYLRDGVPVEVRVLKDHFGKPEEKNGVMCVSNLFCDQQYTWYQELDELSEVLRDWDCRTVPLAKGEFALREFYNMCDKGLWHPEPMAGQVRWGEDDDEEETPPEKRVLNHMDFLPDEAASRRVVYMIIEKHGDGSYRIREDISVKYPEYVELMDQAIDFAIPDGEVLVLPVDVNENLRCAADIQKAVCAFRVAGDVIETFGPKEGLLEFAALLREARDSGRCTVLKDGD